MGATVAMTAVVSPPLQAEDKIEPAPTLPEIEGPFYPIVAQKDMDFDLTQIADQDG